MGNKIIVYTNKLQEFVSNVFILFFICNLSDHASWMILLFSNFMFWFESTSKYKNEVNALYTVIFVFDCQEVLFSPLSKVYVNTC